MWTLDYLLFAYVVILWPFLKYLLLIHPGYRSQLGISRVFFHDGIGFKYNLVCTYGRFTHICIVCSLKFQIQPFTLTRSTLDGSPLSNPLPPHIQPQYYAAIIAAEAIGNCGNTKVIELNITDTSISGYAFYQGGQLTSVILINSLAFFTTTTTARPSTHVNLTFASSTSKMKVKRLFVPYVQFFSNLFLIIY